MHDNLDMRPRDWNDKQDPKSFDRHVPQRVEHHSCPAQSLPQLLHVNMLRKHQTTKKLDLDAVLTCAAAGYDDSTSGTNTLMPAETLLHETTVLSI